jgi:molecular chaperone GrpE
MIDQPEREQGANPAAPGRGAEEAAGVGPRPGADDVAGADLRPGESSEAAAGVVEKDLEALEQTKRERDEYLELAQRTRADFENYRKRVAKETSEALSRGKAELARELLPVIDNLERALESGSDPGAHEPLVKGVGLVLEELRGRLAGAGVEAFDPKGEKFDPTLHEALSAQSAEGTEPGLVIETLEKGYRLNGQVLRPARVVVSK